jgi:ABC-2 type transport system permease protein
MKALAGQVRAELTLFIRDKTVTFFSLFFPLLTVLFFGYLNRGGRVGDVPYASFLIAGGIGMVVSSAAFENLGVALARQREDGVLKRVGGTPLRPRTLVGAKVLSATAVILVQAVLMTVANIFLFKATIPGNVLWSLAVVLVGILAFTAMGFALAGLSRNTDVAGAAARALSLPMQFLCGTLIPIDQMPVPLQTIARALPLTYFVDALRSAALSGEMAGHGREWAVLMGCLIVGLAIAVRTFRWE